MKALKLIIILFAFFCTLNKVVAQTNKKVFDFTNVKLKELNLNILKKIGWSNIDVKKNHLLFFKINSSKNGITIVELYKKEDSVSKQLKRELEIVFDSWMFTKNKTLIIPIFLVYNIEVSEKIMEFYYSIQESMYSENKELIKGFLMPPIIIPYSYRIKYAQ